LRHAKSVWELSAFYVPPESSLLGEKRFKIRDFISLLAYSYIMEKAQEVSIYHQCFEIVEGEDTNF